MDINNSPDEIDRRKFVDSDDVLPSHDDHLQEAEHALHNALETMDGASGSISFPKRKWNRLRKHYHDQYLEVFKETSELDQNNYFSGDLPPTQLGAVLWQSEEKARLYNALCRKGRQDLQTLSDLVVTKSVVEIKAYLDCLREQETDRQLFEAQPKNASHAEIPAAFEIGPECEAELDRAADALLAFQEQYDFAAGQQSNKLWLIDHEVAAELDQKADDTEMPDNVDDQISDDGVASMDNRASTLFRLSTLLGLSERVFMNKGSNSPESWQNIAEEGQRPGLTLECVSLLYDLVVNFLRRVVQSCLFIAKSRLRAAASRDYRPGGIVRFEDIVATLDVLGVKRNAESFWVGLARRNGLKIVDDAHRRGVDGKAIIPYDEVEETLSNSGGSRSLSAVPEASVMTDKSPEGSFESPETTENEIDLDDSSADEGSRPEPEDEIPPGEEAEGHLRHGAPAGDEDSESEERTNARISTPKRLQILQSEQDKYLEKLDQEARQQEESRLFSLLGAEGEKKIKEKEKDDLGVRPRELRKSVEDCRGWSVDYQAGWEPSAKRRRLDAAAQ